MKLPTLNIDAKLNTKTLQKDVAEANKKFQQIGGKATAFAGGVGGRLGALGSLGGTAGSAFVAAGAGVAVAGGFFALLKANRAVLQSFNESVRNGASLMDQFNQSGDRAGFQRAGVSEMLARRLEAALPTAQRFEAATQGFWDTFWASAMDSQGKIGGVLGATVAGAESAGQATKGAMALAGAVLGGKDIDTARSEAIMATAPGLTAEESAIGAAFMQRGLARNAQGQSAFSQQAAGNTDVMAWFGLKVMELFA